MGFRETKARPCQTIERNSGTSSNQTTKSSSSQWKPLGERWKFKDIVDASSSALQNTDKEQWRNPPQYWETQDEIRLHWCRWKHETKARRSWTDTPSRSHYCKKDEFFNSLQSCAQIHSGASSIKDSRCKDDRGERMKNWRKFRQGSWRKSETRKKWSMKQGRTAENPFCIIDGCLSSSEIGAGTSISELQRQGRTPRWHCKRWFRRVRSVYWTRIISISTDSRKSHGREIKASRMFRTSSWCNISLHSSRNGRCINVIQKIPKSECQEIWIRPPKQKCPKSLSSMEDVVLKKNLYGHPLARLLWERQFEKILLKHGWEKIPNWECLFVHREKGLFLSAYVDDIKLAGKKQNLDPMWKLLNKEVDLREQHLSLIMYTWDALNDNGK